MFKRVFYPFGGALSLECMVFSANLTEHQAAQFWATWAGGRDVAMGIGAVIGGALVAIYSFQTLFILIVVLNIIGTAIVTKIIWLKNDN